MPTDSQPSVQIKIRLVKGDLFPFGPGKAALLDAILQCESISAAGRNLGLSYTKTRRLVDEMNTSFREPLVETAKGGAQGGGARVTGMGLKVLKVFRAMENKARDAIREDLETILSNLE